MDTNACDVEHGIDHEPEREVYRVRTDPDESICMAIVDLVSTVAGRDPIELPPLHDRIDTDALESLFRLSADRPGRSRGYAEFTYVDCLVRVAADGEVVVRPYDTT